MTPASSAAPASSTAIERAAALADEEESLRRQLVRANIGAAIAGPVMIGTTGVYVLAVVISFLAAIGDGFDGLGVAALALIGLTSMAAAILGPCAWVRGRREKLQARLDGMLRPGA